MGNGTSLQRGEKQLLLKLFLKTFTTLLLLHTFKIDWCLEIEIAKNASIACLVRFTNFVRCQAELPMKYEFERIIIITCINLSQAMRKIYCDGKKKSGKNHCNQTFFFKTLSRK